MSVTDHSGVRITVAMDVGKAVAVKVEKLGGSDVGGCEGDHIVRRFLWLKV